MCLRGVLCNAISSSSYSNTTQQWTNTITSISFYQFSLCFTLAKTPAHKVALISSNRSSRSARYCTRVKIITQRVAAYYFILQLRHQNCFDCGNELRWHSLKTNGIPYYICGERRCIEFLCVERGVFYFLQTPMPPRQVVFYQVASRI